jgi:hypothetical protein
VRVFHGSFEFRRVVVKAASAVCGFGQTEGEGGKKRNNKIIPKAGARKQIRVPKAA